MLLVVQVTPILGEDNVHSQKPDQLARPEASGTLNDNTGAKSGMSIGSHVSCYEACRGRAHRRGVKSLMRHAPRSDDSSGPLEFTLIVRENVLDCRDTAFECRLGDSSTIFPFYEEVVELLRVRDREPKLSDVIEERDQGFAVPLGRRVLDAARDSRIQVPRSRGACARRLHHRLCARPHPQA